VLLFPPYEILVRPIFFFSKNTPGSKYIIRTPSGKLIPDLFVDFGTSITLMDDDVSFE